MAFWGNGISERKVGDSGYSKDFTEWLKDKEIPEINKAFVNAVTGPDEINPEWASFMHAINTGGASFSKELKDQLDPEELKALSEACGKIKTSINNYRHNNGLDEYGLEVTDFTTDAKPFYDIDGQEAPLPAMDKEGNIIEESVDNINNAMDDRQQVYNALINGP